MLLLQICRRACPFLFPQKKTHTPEWLELFNACLLLFSGGFSEGKQKCPQSGSKKTSVHASTPDAPGAEIFLDFYAMGLPICLPSLALLARGAPGVQRSGALSEEMGPGFSSRPKLAGFGRWLGVEHVGGKYLFFLLSFFRGGGVAPFWQIITFLFLGGGWTLFRWQMQSLDVFLAI